MPETFLQRDFSAGWCPSDDEKNGRPNCLLQMNNLELDKNGALTLTGGTVVKRTLSSTAHTLFSRYLNGTRCDYAALASGAVYRNTTSIATGGDTTNAAFGTAFDYTLVCSGTKRLKDNGTTAVNLGILPPTNPIALSLSYTNSPYQIIGDISTGYVVPKGTAVWSAAPSSLDITTDAAGDAVVQTYPGVSHNANSLTGPAGTGVGTEDDYVILNFSMAVLAPVSFQLDILLVTSNAAGDPVTDYYTFKINDITQLEGFNDFNGTIKIRRSEFTRVGGSSQQWSAVYGYRITLVAPPAFVLKVWSDVKSFANMVIKGSSIAQFGTYDYVQINVNNTGSYIAKSTIGPIVYGINIDGGTALITPQDPTGIDAQCNEAWIFRRGGNLGGAWYRVLVFTTGGGWSAAYDALSDQAALTLKITINLNLISTASIAKIFDIVGPVQGRWYYFTANFVYPSDLNDPDLVDASLAVRTCGSNSELFMWARAVSATVVLVGTSIEVYLLTGTFATFPDNSVDIYYQRLGVKFPPLTYDAVEYGGAVYYLASDGWRMCVASGSGSAFSINNNQLLVSPNTDRLYRGETCYGYTPPNLKIAPGSVRFPVTVARNKLWCFITGTGRIEVYDFVRQYWRTINYLLGDVSAACSTQDGEVLGFFTSDAKEREVCTLSSKLVDGATNQVFSMLPTFKDNGQPRQRKDTYTLKSRCLTGNATISVRIVNDQNVSTVVSGALTSAAGTTEQFLDLSQTAAFQLTKYWQVGMSGQCSDVNIEDYSIDYDPRPVPLTFLRVVGLNYNTTARKRIYTIPFQIDTLSHNVLIAPIIDGALQATLSVNSNRKQSFDYQLPIIGVGSDIQIGIDYEWLINGQGQEFEFYGFEEIRNIEVFPDPRRSLVIPVTNFGDPVKKRVRGWPFVIDTRGLPVTFTPIVDGVVLPLAATVLNTPSKKTVRVFYKTDVFGIDYSGYFKSTTDFEMWEILHPDVVQALPPARQFDQVGPQEFLRWGKVIKIELRVLPFGVAIPYNIYFSDSTVYNSSLTVVSSKEDSYFIDMPKGVSGRILRVEIGPTSFDFHRYYMRFLCAPSGGQEDTELQWVTVPNTGGFS